MKTKANYSALLRAMQTKRSRDGVKQLMRATPQELGRAAVEAAKPGRKPRTR